MTKWDYILVENATIDQITTMGRRGWELCGVRSSLADSTIYFYLKRPLSYQRRIGRAAIEFLIRGTDDQLPQKLLEQPQPLAEVCLHYLHHRQPTTDTHRLSRLVVR